METGIDPFDRMETGNDRFVKAVRSIIAAAIVVIGTTWLVWFWFVAPN
jgi:hypothetical protein